MDEIIVGEVKNSLGAWDKTCLLYPLTSQQFLCGSLQGGKKTRETAKPSLHLGILKLGGTCRGAGLTMRGSETASSFLPLQLAW